MSNNGTALNGKSEFAKAARFTTMTHFIMKAPPPDVPSQILARGMSEGLYIVAVKPDYDAILKDIEHIGDNWHLRNEHTKPDLIPNTRDILEGERSAVWHFMRGQEKIGICVAITKGGFDGDLKRISGRFGLEAEKGSEIYKVGLFKQYIGKGYGHNFLPAVQSALLDGQESLIETGIKEIEPADFVYLNTRLTNTVDSRNFYAQLGYEWAGEESWPIDDAEMAFLSQSTKQNTNGQRRPLVPFGAFSKRSVA